MSDNIPDREFKQLEDELGPKLSSYMTDSPSQKETNQLISTLQPTLDQANRTFQPSIIKQCWLQMCQYKWSFWIMSVAVFTMLTLITEVTAPATNIQPFSFILPLYLLVSMAYSYRTRNKEMRMVEMVTPFPPALLLLTRALNVLVINLFLGLLGSAYLLTAFDAAPIHFLLSWLAPSLFMFGALAYIMLWKGVKTGMGAAIIIWGCGMVITRAGNDKISLFPDLLPFLQGGACLLGCALLFAAFRRAKNQYRLQT